MFPAVRMRRLRRTGSLRSLLHRVRLSRSDFIYPLFVDENLKEPAAIPTLPSQNRYPTVHAVEKASELVKLGIPGILLFGIPKWKDEEGSSASAEDGVIQRTVREIKREVGDCLTVITDVCLCQYTSHGQCGRLKDGQVSNDLTLKALEDIALSHARAGADIVAPSAMMDGQVVTLRRSLDNLGFHDTAIMAYSSKYASNLYSPFRSAVDIPALKIDRRSHQMDYATGVYQALREVALDIEEGADIVMVKPALPYLDVITSIRRRFQVPLAAYNVSGEYAMVKAAVEKGWLDEPATVLEILSAIKRAGADIIITFHAIDACKWLETR